MVTKNPYNFDMIQHLPWQNYFCKKALEAGKYDTYLWMARKAEELFPVQNLPPILVMSMTQCFLRLTKRFHMAILTRIALRRVLLKNLRRCTTR